MAKSKKAIPQPPAKLVQQAGKPQHLHSIGILILIFLGILGMFGAVMYIVISAVHLPFFEIFLGNMTRSYFLFTGIIGAIVATIWIIGSAGVITEKPWSRKLLI